MYLCFSCRLIPLHFNSVPAYIAPGLKLLLSPMPPPRCSFDIFDYSPNSLSPLFNTEFDIFDPFNCPLSPINPSISCLSTAHQHWHTLWQLWPLALYWTLSSVVVMQSKDHLRFTGYLNTYNTQHLPKRSHLVVEQSRCCSSGHWVCDTNLHTKHHVFSPQNTCLCICPFQTFPRLWSSSATLPHPASSQAPPKASSFDNDTWFVSAALAPLLCLLIKKF